MSGTKISHHQRNAITGLEPASPEALATAKQWLGDVPQDVIVLEAGRLLGISHVSQLASLAEGSGAWIVTITGKSLVAMQKFLHATTRVTEQL
jgi:hypothetical protein